MIVGIGATFVPHLVDETNGLVDATPGYVQDLTEGRGRLGFLERKYQIVEKVQEQVNKGDAAKRLFGFSDTAVAVTKGIITLVAATVTIFFLTLLPAARRRRRGSSASTRSCPSAHSRAGDVSAATSTRRSPATSPATC